MFLDICQAQPQFQLSKAELALLLIYPAARHIASATDHISSTTHPPVRTSSDLAGNHLNLLCNIGRPTAVHLKQFSKI